MAHVQKLVDGKGKKVYKVRWRSRHAGAVKFHSKAFSRLKDAEAFAHDLRPGQDWTAARRFFTDYSEAWIQSRISKGCKVRTIEHYRGCLRFANRYFDGVRINEITPIEAQGFLNWLRSSDDFTKGLKTPRSIRGAWMPFRAALAYAVAQGVIPSNPTAGISLPALKSDDDRQDGYYYLTPQEVEAIASALAAHNRKPYDLLVLFAAYTGLRRGEVSGLNVRHIKVRRSHLGWGGEVRVRQQRRKAPLDTLPDDPTRDPCNDGWLIEPPKSGRSRVVPLPPWLAEAMHDYLTGSHPDPSPDRPLWPGRRHAKGSANGVMDFSSPWDPQSFYRYHFKRALRDSGLPIGVRFHDLRHTYASRLAHEGQRPTVVARLMGHADATITLKVYTHLWPEDLSAAVLTLDRPTAPAQRDNVVPLRSSGGAL